MAVCKQDKSIYKQILGSNAIRGSEIAACSLPAGSFCIWRVCELLLAALEWLKLYLSDWLQLSCLLQVQIPKWGPKLVMYKSWTSLLQASSQVLNFIKLDFGQFYQKMPFTYIKIQSWAICLWNAEKSEILTMSKEWLHCLNEGGGHISEVGLLNTSKVICGALYLCLFICLFAIEF